MEEAYEFFVEQGGIKIVFDIIHQFKEWIKRKEVVLTYNLEKSKKWREAYEKKNFNASKFFENILEDISQKFENMNKVYIDGYLPIPFYVALGARLTLSRLLNRNEYEKIKKIKVKNQLKWKINSLKLIKKERITKIPTLLILESKNSENEKYDFLIKSNKNKFSRNSINSYSLKRQLKKFMIEINNLETKRKIEVINVSIVGSPLTSFLVGEFLSKHNFLFNIFHFSSIEKRNIIRCKLGPGTNIELF